MAKSNKTETDNKVVKVSNPNPETAKVSETKTAKVAKVSPSIVIDSNDETALIAESAKVLKAEKSISAIKSRFSDYSAIYGGNVWKMIFSRCKDIRRTEISRIGENVKREFMDYLNALKHEYKRLDGCKDFRTLCGFVGGSDIRDWFKGATDFVSKFYSNVIDGNPCTLVSYVYKDGFVLKAYQPRELTATNAVSVLNTCVSNAISVARKRVNLIANGGDLGNCPVANERVSGAVVSAFFLNPDGTIGAKITPDNKVYPSLMKADTNSLETLTDYRKRVIPETPNK